VYPFSVYPFSVYPFSVYPFSVYPPSVYPPSVSPFERRDNRRARPDVECLESQQDEVRPQQVRELHGDEQRAERHAGRHAFRPESNREVADEHLVRSR
jgi:hypothetical protein